ncbi:hypothetical protein Tco_1032755 [Tanacetum coccineum]|uniref:Uncharacterized protein n=1 Tax=Tanacetum coccineum TaxID=301880 RepID=A0ABQ5GDJ3_9ASTR
MEYVKKSKDKRALHKREYDSRVNERQMQTTEEKVDTSKALDASLVDIKSSGTESLEQDTSSRSGNDAHADDADIKPIYDEELMAEVQLIADHNVFTTGQQYTEQPEFNNEGEVDQNPKQCHDTCPLHGAMSTLLCLRFHSNKTTNGNKPVEQISVAKKPERQIPKGHRFSIKKTSVVHEKTMTPRSCLRWKPTGKIFKTVGLRWIPAGKIFKFSTTKVDSEPPHGSNTNITNLQECIQTLDLSACTSINVQEEQNLDLSAGTPFKLKKERIKTWTKDNVISGRPRLHGIASLKEKSARPSSQGIRSLLTS